MDINADKKILTPNQSNSPVKTYFSPDSNFVDEINELKESISAENLSELVPDTQNTEDTPVDSLLSSVVNEFQLKNNSFIIIKKDDTPTAKTEQKTVTEPEITEPHKVNNNDIQQIENSVATDEPKIQGQDEVISSELTNVPAQHEPEILKQVRNDSGEQEVESEISAIVKDDTIIEEQPSEVLMGRGIEVRQSVNAEPEQNEVQKIENSAAINEPKNPEHDEVSSTD